MKDYQYYKALTSVTEQDYAEGILDEWGVLYSKDGKRLLAASSPYGKKFEYEYAIKPGCEIICDNAFYEFLEGSLLCSVMIPPSVIAIGDNAFAACDLHVVNLHEGLIFLGDCVFDFNENLSTVVLPNSLEFIGNSCFSETNYKRPLIPSNVKHIEGNPYSLIDIIDIDCESPNFCVDDGILYDAKRTKIISCFKDKAIIDVPESVTSLGDYCFEGCNVTNILLSNNLKEIGKGAFQQNTNLAQIVLPDGLLKIEDSAFSDCWNLKRIVIPSSVSYIGKNAFAHCKKLKEVIINSRNIDFGESPFWGCESLDSIIVPNKDMFTKGLLQYSNILHTSFGHEISLSNIEQLYYKLLYDVLQAYNRCTPKMVSQLENRQIFVFGTDVCGRQKYGAAGLAARKFGAKAGISEGITGNSYAIPTMGATIDQTIDAINRFEIYVRNNMSNQYLVTAVGCGHAGYNVEEIAPSFSGCIGLSNVMLPSEFIQYYRQDCIAKLGLSEQGSGDDDNDEGVLMYYDERVHGVIRYLQENGIPFNQEGGYALLNDDGMVIAEAELGIEQEKVVFLPFNSQSEAAFKNAGYTIMNAEDYLNNKKKV